MVERVARALFHADNATLPRRYRWEEANVAVRGAYVRRTIAALQAMREPTPAMVEASRVGVDWDPDDRSTEPSATPERCWQAMIDAALTPPKSGDPA
jgi:hypothetical protein